MMMKVMLLLMMMMIVGEMLERCVMDGSELEILHLDSMSFSTGKILLVYRGERLC